MTCAARLAALLLLASGMPAALASTSTGGLRDQDFGVVAGDAVGLERRVEMYQWHRDGQRYLQAWNAELVDSREFAAGHRNPPEMPLQGRRWEPARVLLDGHPVAPDAVEALARWQPLRPDFSALPGNLSATFQPEGDGLGSAANPAHPEVGDLRVTWRERRMPPTRAGLVLGDGRWELDPAQARARATAQDPAGERPGPGFGWILLGAATAGLLAAVVMLRRRRRR